MYELVSVVITTYKRTKDEISKSIYSVLNQTYKNIELIIVDDSPRDYVYRDEIKEFCESIKDNRVRYIQHEVNKGACVARNTGMNNCSGRYISFLDDDDEYLPNRIENMVKLIEEDEEIVLVYCNANIVDAISKEIKGSFFDGNQQYKGKVYDEIMCSNFVGSTSMGLIRIEALKKIGGFDPLMEASQDWDVWIRLSQIGCVTYTTEKLINYYKHSGERISNNTQKRIKGIRRLNYKCKDYLFTHKDAWIARKRFEMRLLSMDRDLIETLKCYIEIVKKCPRDIIENIKLIKVFGHFFIKYND